MHPVIDSVVYVIPAASSWLAEMASAFSAIAAMFSAITAAVAVWYTRKQIKSHERHNRLMATPHLSAWNHADIEPGLYQFSIENTGIGPAVVREISVSVGGEKIKGWSADLVELAVEKLFGATEHEASYEMFVINDVLPPGKKFTVLSIKIPGTTGGDIQEFVTEQVSLMIKYESILGDKYVFDSEELKRLRAAALE
ncbi:hypothetical protein [Phytopseudomonas seleniipraecipitans]|uniref:Uncharacterized protein n=1 Tax=Phytopseudomonas seleniipraecipitans TaxID=640205 RepID=A0A1G7JB42_9GAMM|nr:hypothetical protein [Pseudomonas seleniipraecipitans]SDF22103.1 hypothetical protein SAMN05216381_1052 [Pseudomonas seleniipraecipitans]